MSKDIILEFNRKHIELRKAGIYVYCTYNSFNASKEVFKSSYLIIKDNNVYFIQKNHSELNTVVVGNNEDNLIDKYTTISMLLELCNIESLVCKDIRKTIHCHEDNKDSIILDVNDNSKSLLIASINHGVYKYTSLITVDNDIVVNRTKPEYEFFYYSIRNANALMGGCHE